MCIPLSSLALLFSLLLSAPPAAADEEFNRSDLDFFERKIRPVLVERCYSCHSPDADDLEGGLRADLREGLLKGGETGPAVVPGNLEESLLISALEYRDGLEMPPEEKLPEEVIRDFKRWVRQGAADPRTGSMEPATDRKRGTAETAELWSLQPVQNPQPPSVQDETWPRTGVDRFLLAKLEGEGLHPVPPAEPAALLRRVSYDLTGLPPAPEDVLAFAADPSEAAYAGYVEKLLASPQFGERWARHWLDVARYGESAGSSRDVLITPAWRYRDYVIDAFNADLPYDRFMTEQIAGDLLEADSPGERSRMLVATGLLAVGSKSLNGGNIPLDIIDDQIDVISKAMLGLTVSCARCHDHKFDPIPTADYYAMAGIFKSTRTWYGGSINRPKTQGEMLDVYLPLGNSDEKLLKRLKEHEKELSEAAGEQSRLGQEFQKLRKRLPEDWQEQQQELRARAATEGQDDPLKPKEKRLLEQIDELNAVRRKLREARAKVEELENEDLPELEFAVGVSEAGKIEDSPIHLRGERQRTGDVVPRGALSCIELENSPTDEISGEQSGRLELARWLTHPEHPLTPRVAVNRIWSRLFGKGLVETTTDFGTNAPPPTHPELLDHLAHRFVQELDWSQKGLIRELVLSQAYRLSNTFDEENGRIDQANSFYWRRDRRRLEAEAIRDSILAASGELNPERPYGSPVVQIGEGEVGRGINLKPLEEPYPYRSVYLPIIRGIVPEFLKAFDFPEPSNPQGERSTTNVPAQSLFLMNNRFVIEQGEQLALRLIAEAEDDRERIATAYLRCFSRLPSPAEVRTARAYLEDCRTGLDVSEITPEEREQITWGTFSQALFSAAEFRYLE